MLRARSSKSVKGGIPEIGLREGSPLSSDWSDHRSGTEKGRKKQSAKGEGPVKTHLFSRKERGSCHPNSGFSESEWSSKRD